LLGIVLFTAVFSVICIIAFVITTKRVITWSEIYFSDGLIIAIVLMPVIIDRRIRRFLAISAALCFMALLTAQTRGLWLTTTFSLLLYGLVQIRRSKNIEMAKIAKVVSVVLLVVVATHVLLLLTVNLDLVTFITKRLFFQSHNKLLDPANSMGYRIYESYMIWRNKTVFGHGSGARIHLFFTQMDHPKFMDWWSIHSGFFDLLHKFGFVGLGLYVIIFIISIRKSVTLLHSPKKIIQTLGTVAFICLLNHFFISITSEYFFKENVMIYMVILIGMVETYTRTSFRLSSAVSTYSKESASP
jgi:hypothetical protein